MKRQYLLFLLLFIPLFAMEHHSIKIISLGNLPLAGHGIVELYYLLGSGFYCMSETEIIKVNLDESSKTMRRLHFRSLASVTDKYTLQLYENDDHVFVRMIPLDKGFSVVERE